MEKNWLFLVVVLVLLFGCADYHYTHSIQKDGKSTLKLTIDYTTVIEEDAELEGKTFSTKLGEFEEEKEAQCVEMISEGIEINCEVDGAIIEISKNLEPGEYYEFTKKDEIPDHIYELKINKIPNLDLIDNVLGIEEVELGKNLTEEEKIKLLAGKELGIKLDYSIAMPGTIFEAYCGEFQAEVNENSATFDLLEIGNDLNPIIVKSKQVDQFYVNLVIGLAIVVFLVLMYLIFFKRAQPKTTRSRRK